MRHCVVERDPKQKGCVVLTGRWAEQLKLPHAIARGMAAEEVERSFGWLVHRGGLLRDRAGRLDVAAVPSRIGVLLNPKPIHTNAGYTNSNRF